MVGRAEGRQDKRTGAKDHNLEHAKGNRYEKKTSNAPQSVRQASRHTQGQRSTRLSNFGFEQWQMERCTVGERTSASSSMRHDERTLRHSDRQTLDEQAIEIMMAKNTILKLNSHVKKPQLVATLIDARLDMLKRDQMQEQLPKLDHSGSTIIVLVSSLSMVKYYADSADIQRLSATYKVDSFAHDGKAGKPDPWENEEWRRNLFGNEVIIMNSQLLLDGFNAFHINIQQFSMIIFDDFHHCLTHRPYTRILQEHYNRLDPKDVRQLRIVGLTATLLKKNSRDGTERKQSIRGLKRTIDVEVFHLKNADARKMHTTEGFNGGASEDSAQLKQCFDAMLEMSEYFEGFCSLCHMQYGKHDFKNSVPWGVGNVKVQEDYEYVSATWHLGACGVKDVMPSKPDGANMPLCPRHTAWATWKSKVPSQHLSAKTSKLLETLRNPKEHKFTVVVSTPLLCHLLFKVVSDFISQFREGRTHVCCLHKYLSDNKKQEETRAFVRWRSQDSCVLIVDYKSCDIPESPFVIIFDAPSESISSILKDKAFNARVTMMENTSTESQDELYSSKIKLPGGVYFYESEAYNIVENFIRRQPYDTWRPPSSFVTVEKNEDGTREKCIIRLPLSCPMRDPKGSTWKDSMEEARTEACVNCIRVLFDHNLLDNTLQPIEVSKQLLPLALPAQPRKKLPYLLSPKIGRLVDESERITLWRMSYIKNHQAGARPVSSDKVAIITSAFPCESFRVPIKGNDQLFQFEPTAYMWNCELQKLVARFHESLVEAGHELFRQEKGRETAYFCFVKDKANSAKSYQAWQSARMDSVDVSMVPVDRLMMDGFARTKVEDRKEKMARFAVRDADSDPIAVLLQETKHWYPAMLKVIETQAHLAALKRSSPPSEHLIFPVLSAYHLQGVLSPGGKEIVQAIGTGVMSTLMSMFAFTGDHSADVSVLERTVQQRSKVIKDIMKADPNLPAFAKLIHGSFSENHVSFLYTLVGTYFCMDGGGFFQAWNLLEWLTSQGENCKGASKKECSAVLGHYLFGNTEHFLGRTPSYMEFQEVDEDDEKILKVYYEGRGWVDYRRQNMENGRLWPQERFAEYHTPTWKTMKYHPEFKTYVSAWMLDPEEQQRPLPNKVTSWLRGKRCASLTTVKHYMGRTPDYVQLQETPCGKLWVKYQDDAWYCYTRYPNGGIGNEKPSGGDAAPIKYSERFKTFKSPHKDQPLANKIVEWERYKSLALLAVPRKSDDEDPVSGQDTDMHVECPNDDEICWRHEGRRFICYGQRAPGGLVYLEREEGVPHVKPRALIYSEELKTWLSPALTEEGKFPAGFKLPGAVVDWLKKYVQRVIKEPQPTLEMYRHQWMKTPWCVVPSYIKTMVPPQLNLPKIEAEVLRFAFRNPVFLVEALTHESFTQSVSPNYQRLEFIGGPLLDLCITLCLQEKELLSVLSDPKLFQAINHCASSPMAYAIAMADSKMAEHILRQSPKLDEAIEYFVGRLEQCRRPSVPPSRKQKRGDVGSEMSPASRKSTQDDAPFSKDISSFLKIAPCDAPRVLSDVFKALAGAVFLDSDWSTFVKTLKPFVMKFVIHQFFQVSKTGEYIPLKSSDQENIKRYAFPLEDLHSEFSKRDWDVEVEELNVSALRGGNGAKEKRDKIVGTAFQRCSQSSSKVMLAASLQESPDVEKWRDVAFAVGKLNGRIVCRTVATNFQLAQKRALWRMRAILKRSLEDKHIRALVIDSVPHADLEESFIAKLAVDKDAIVSPLRKPTAPLDLEADPVPSQSLDTDESAAVYCSDCEMWHGKMSKIKIGNVKYGTLGTGEIRASDDKIGWQSTATREVKIFSLKSVKTAQWSSVTSANFLLKLFEPDRAHVFSNLTEPDLQTLLPFLKSYDIIPTNVKLCTDAKHWGALTCEENELVFSKEQGSARFGIPNSCVTNITPAGKADLQVEFEDPGEQFDGDYVQEIRFYIPPLNGVNQAEELHQELLEKCEKRGGQSIVDFGDFKFLMPSARYELQIFKDHLKLHGRSFDHNVKFKQIENIFLLKTPRLEEYFVLGLTTALRQGQTSFHHIVLQMAENDTADVQVKLDAGELAENKLPSSGRIAGSMHDVMGHVLKILTKKSVIMPNTDFESENRNHSLQCTYKQSMGYLWVMKKSFMYGPKPIVHIPYTNVEVVMVTPPPDGGRCFDINVKIASGQSNEFNRIDKSDYETFLMYLRNLGIRVANASGGGQQAFSTAGPGGDSEGSGDKDYSDEEDKDSDWAPSSPEEKKRKKR